MENKKNQNNLASVHLAFVLSFKRVISLNLPPLWATFWRSNWPFCTVFGKQGSCRIGFKDSFGIDLHTYMCVCENTQAEKGIYQCVSLDLNKKAGEGDWGEG